MSVAYRTAPTNLPSSTIADSDLRSDVEDELDWDPAVPAASIGVSVTDHAVTVSGTVHTLSHRLAAVKAVRRVKGVHAIIDDIVVVPPASHGSTDQEIALAVERILEYSSSVPDGIMATLRSGLVTLTGAVDFHYQKQGAFDAVRDVKGVTWVQNNISVQPHQSDNVVRSKIVAAMHRNADLDSRDISVVASGHEVWLSGTTRSYAARAQAETAAWASPGAEQVHNNIQVC